MSMKGRDEPMDCGTSYRIMDYMGSGAYGTVCAALNLHSLKKVAIKKCKDVFKTRTLAKRTLREIRLLRHIAHPNIVHFQRLLPPSGPSFNDLYLVFELMESDLSQIIRSPQDLGIDHVQFFLYQLLSAVDYLHSAHVVHRDIKPRNILVNSDCTIKLADFGLARVLGSEPEGAIAITDYVTTRWYRAPEVLAGWAVYGYAVDMWAVGCILAELLTRTPLFPGRDTLRQLEKIVGVLGKPPCGFINNCMKFVYRRYLQGLPAFNGRAIQVSNPAALDLIAHLLVFNPDHRYTASRCLQHDFISSFTDIADADQLCPAVKALIIPVEAFEHEISRYDLDSLKKEVLLENDEDEEEKDMDMQQSGRMDLDAEDDCTTVIDAHSSPHRSLQTLYTLDEEDEVITASRLLSNSTVVIHQPAAPAKTGVVSARSGSSGYKSAASSPNQAAPVRPKSDSLAYSSEPSEPCPLSGPIDKAGDMHSRSAVPSPSPAMEVAHTPEGWKVHPLLSNPSNPTTPVAPTGTPQLLTGSSKSRKHRILGRNMTAVECTVCGFGDVLFGAAMGSAKHTLMGAKGSGEKGPSNTVASTEEVAVKMAPKHSSCTVC